MLTKQDVDKLYLIHFLFHILLLQSMSTFFLPYSFESIIPFIDVWWYNPLLLFPHSLFGQMPYCPKKRRFDLKFLAIIFNLISKIVKSNSIINKSFLIIFDRIAIDFCLITHASCNLSVRRCRSATENQSDVQPQVQLGEKNYYILLNFFLIFTHFL